MVLTSVARQKKTQKTKCARYKNPFGISRFFAEWATLGKGKGGRMRVSVLASIYKNEKAENFREAMDSIINQTRKPDEIVLVRDGQVPEELQSVIDEYVQGNEMFKYVPLEENGGLGNALKVGLEHATGELIARMDTDDISAPDRLEKQIRFMEEHPEISVLGGEVEEFIGTVENIVAQKFVPCEDDEIKEFIKLRNPFNHPTVIFRKEAVDSVGGYVELHYLEDYYLWCRMAVNGHKFANLPDTLVYMRTDENTYRRRGGMEYYRSYKQLEKYKYDEGITDFWDYGKALFVRYAQAVMPNDLRKVIYKGIRHETGTKKKDKEES